MRQVKGWQRSGRAVFRAWSQPARELGACLASAVLAAGGPPVGAATQPGPIGEPETHVDSTSIRREPQSTPVVLVHGYGGSAGQWTPLRWSLHRGGFTTVRTMEYRPFDGDIPALARRLRQLVLDLVAVTGAERVHLVGHSLGGVIIRHAVTLDGLDGLVGAAVTIASPHGGSPLARTCTTALGAGLRPGSPVLRSLETGARAGLTRWTALSAGLDVVVPPARARIRPAALGARNLTIEGEGHLSVLFSPIAARAVVAALRDADRDLPAESAPAKVVALRSRRIDVDSTQAGAEPVTLRPAA